MPKMVGWGCAVNNAQDGAIFRTSGSTQSCRGSVDAYLQSISRNINFKDHTSSTGQLKPLRDHYSPEHVLSSVITESDVLEGMITASGVTVRLGKLIM